ncbi:cytidylyltransferase domain-containing protein [Treponema brennaborense]|uniref:Acylneuraminate cytidylyltransferase n=1 Tax=Treponema brennaborense (strain DSM 12168 / CIP 105900 / DD5/3) TaxID=906968 RepID=F4LIN3_TREBD|nr:methyltransferase domain-containing protein [Treponema brennaborense]AEE17258.1 acylneuraminate cytidylyltransferase [Treponema brennaborense DSM 12168]
MIIIIVQCRLSSSRLPRKALLPLGGKPLIAWTLEAMKQVPADRYILATDADSESELQNVARECGWECFAGSRDDVLDRFCQVAVRADCVLPSDTIVRATGDNPFLFYEAARALVDEMKKHPCDYITWTGLPHGSGVELINARSLIEACGMTSDPYDHEHVGPALYKHPENFAAVLLTAPSAWNHPVYRTTVDSYADYRRALRIVRAVSGSKTVRKPYAAEEICAACATAAVTDPVLCVPSVKKGCGTGHLRRCIDIALKTGADLYIPASADLAETSDLLEEAKRNGLESWQILDTLPAPGEYSLIVTDRFSLDRSLAQQLYAAAPVAAIDEGGSFTGYCDYLLDIIPSYKLSREANLCNSGFIPLPKNRKPECGGAERTFPPTLGDKVLVSAGGEDPAGLTVPAAIAFAENGKSVTAVVADPAAVRAKIPESLQKNIRFVPPISNLREKLYLYDVVVTHYGFTAFEAVAAGCGVVLLGTSSLHVVLAQKYGFQVLAQDALNANAVNGLLLKPELLYPESPLVRAAAVETDTLDSFVLKLARGRRNTCPVCGTVSGRENVPDPIAARTAERTFRRCAKCGMLYMSWTVDAAQTEYGAAYFFDDYKKQYGKTYLEDFTSIKAQCVRRMSVIDALFWMRTHTGGKIRKSSALTPSVLDIGCAMGPFLDAASDAGWQVYGTDISGEAIEYVQNILRYPAVCAPFPDFDPAVEFGVGQFDAITMWYVIEHFTDLDSVLKAVSGMLKKGGIFAFSTPSASGVSAKYSPESFFARSPADHYTLWEPGRAADILKRYGFRTLKCISTGHHAERFPAAQKHGMTPHSPLHSLLSCFSRFCRLGDTFELYCVKK